MFFVWLRTNPSVFLLNIKKKKQLEIVSLFFLVFSFCFFVFLFFSVSCCHTVNCIIRNEKIQFFFLVFCLIFCFFKTKTKTKNHFPHFSKSKTTKNGTKRFVSNDNCQFVSFFFCFLFFFQNQNWRLYSRFSLVGSGRLFMGFCAATTGSSAFYNF